MCRVDRRGEASVCGVAGERIGDPDVVEEGYDESARILDGSFRVEGEMRPGTNIYPSYLPTTYHTHLDLYSFCLILLTGLEAP